MDFRYPKILKTKVEEKQNQLSKSSKIKIYKMKVNKCQNQKEKRKRKKYHVYKVKHAILLK